MNACKLRLDIKNLFASFVLTLSSIEQLTLICSTCAALLRSDIEIRLEDVKSGVLCIIEWGKFEHYAMKITYIYILL